MSFSLYATHPYASQAGYDNSSTNYYTGTELCPASSGKTFCPAGQTITDMEVTEDGHLVAGYGDWNSNVDSFGVPEGRVGVVPLDLSDGTWGDMFYAGSEAIDNIRKLNGKLYIPTTDPSDRAATGNPSGNISGYVTNETGDWTFISNGSPANIHTFDVATLSGTDRYTGGSKSMTSGAGSSNVRTSTDGGTTWSDSYSGTSLNGSARSYWTAALDGKLYAQKSSSDGGGVVVYDGTSWEDVSGFSCSTTSARVVDVFDGHIVCYRSNTSVTGVIGAFDGSDAADVTFTTSAVGSATTRDFFIDDQYLYILTDGGEIYRTDSLSDSEAWKKIDSSTPSGASTIAVHDDYIYIGASSGQIFRSSAEISGDMLVDSDTIPEGIDGATSASCFGFNVSTGTVTGYFDHELDDTSNPACPREVVIPAAIDGVAVTNIATSAFSNSQITSLTIPNSVTSIEYSAFSNNQITSLTIPDSVTNIGNSAFSNNQITDLVVPNSVTSIGLFAFSNNQITSLTIPNSVTSIGDGAFSYNQITELVIPDSVTSIGNSAFSNNQITDLVVPDSVTSIGASAFAVNKLEKVYMQGKTELGVGVFDPVDAASFFECIDSMDPYPTDLSEYVPCYESSFASSESTNVIRLYANHPEHYQDEILAETTYAGIFGVEPAVIGALIVNPASAVSNYSSQGSQIHEPTTKVGEELSSYSAKALLDTYPDVTAEDLADIYYRQGDEVTIDPLQISGYTSPQSITATLAGESTNFNFVYTSQGGDNNNSNGQDGDSDSGAIGAPSTGFGFMRSLARPTGIVVIVVAVVAMVVATIVYSKHRRAS